MGTQILTLEAAQSLDFHFDLGAGLFSKRKISIMIFLSSPDDYEGGQLDLMGSQYPPFRRERGDVLIFPSFYVNSFHPVSSGRLQVLLTWMHGSQQFN
jgi:PKHD-type hydroxylase